MPESALVVANELRGIIILLTHNSAGFIDIAEPHTWRGHRQEPDLGPVSIHGSDVFSRIVRLVRFMTLDRTDYIQEELEAEQRQAPFRIRLHGESPPGRLRERLLRARPLPANVHARGGRRPGAVEGRVQTMTDLMS